MKMKKRVFKGISGMIFQLVMAVGTMGISNSALAQCTVDITVSQDPTTCFSGVFLDAIVSGGTVQSWTYFIDGFIVGTNSTEFLNLTPGTYIASVIIITDQGCTAGDDFSFIVAGIPVSVDAGADIISCQTQTQLSVNVTSPNSYSVLWSPPGMLDDPISETPLVVENVYNQWFIVDVMDDVTGCINSDTVYVTQHNPLFDTLYLCNDSVLLDLGPGGDFYNWIPHYNDDYTTQAIYVDQTGVYQAYADFPGCAFLTSIFNVVECQDTCSLYVSSNSTPSGCGDEWYQFFANVSGPTDSIVYDYGDGSTFTTSGISGENYYPQGDYTLTVTAYYADGCVATYTEQISADATISVDIWNDSLSCGGDIILTANVTGSTGEYEYLWFIDGLSFPGTTQPNPVIPEITQPTVITLFVSDSTGGCNYADTIIIFPNLQVIETYELCLDSILLIAPPYSELYTWNFVDAQGNNSLLPEQGNMLYANELGTYYCLSYTSGCNQVTHEFYVEECQNTCSLSVSSNVNLSGCGVWYSFFANVSVGIDSLVYDYDDGSTFTTSGISGANYYPTGDYTLTVTAYYADGCVATYTEQISVAEAVSVEILEEDTVACNGTLLMSNIVSGGSGNNIYSWEPAIMMNDPTSATPFMTVLQTTWVSVTVVDTINGCSGVDSILVYANTAVNETIELCADSILLQLDPGSTYYSWIYIEPIGGQSTGLPSTGNEVWALEVGTYVATNYYTGCTFITHTWIVTECTDSDDVWPGDANSDNIVTNADALYLGLAFNQTGPVRPAATLNWTGQPAPDWTFNFAVNNVNLKHADCDGNGIINFDDTLAIDLNYLQTHNKFDAATATGHPLLWVEATPDTVGLEQAIDIVVHLGTAADPIDSLHGVAFTLTFDQWLLTEIGYTVDFDNCVLGTEGDDVLTFQKSMFLDGAVDIAVTRNTLQNFQGYGPIAHARIVTTDNLSGMTDLPIGLSGVVALTAGEEEVILSTMPDTVVIDPTRVGIVEPEQLDVTIYPNPTNGIVTIIGVDKARLTVLNSIGQVVFESRVSSNRTTLDLSALNNGIYILKLENENGVAIKKLRVLR